MTSSRAHLATLPPVSRYAVVGATACALLGGLVGLVVGLRVYPATAWFAVFEVGVPAGIVGAAMGALVGLLAVTVHGIRKD
jgi:ABC-type uncharacterized transport system permease subunit